MAASMERETEKLCSDSLDYKSSVDRSSSPKSESLLLVPEAMQPVLAHSSSSMIADDPPLTSSRSLLTADKRPFALHDSSVIMHGSPPLILEEEESPTPADDSSSPISSLSSLSEPQCRICQGGSEANHPFVSPCRCSGSLKFVHGNCLRKWMECSHGNPNSRNRHGAPACELCGYTFTMRKRLRVFCLQCTNVRYPNISLCDRLLHTIFIVCFLLVLVCGMMSLLLARLTPPPEDDTTPDPLVNSDPMTTRSPPPEDAGEKIERVAGSFTDSVSVVGAAISFLCFFVGLLSECKAKRSVFHLLQEFVKCNQVWVIQDYDPLKDAKDSERKLLRQAT